VADKYDLPRRMTFNAAVERCEWIESRSVWRLHIRDTKTDTVSTHECQFLFAGTGGLVVPRKLDVPGASSFQGPIFHSAQWRNDVDLTGKRVVLFGNGCTAAQIVPSIVGDVAHLTQIVRTKHWIFPPPVDAASHAFMKLLTRYVPGSMLLQRFLVFLAAERSFTGFHMTARGAAFRRKKRAEVEAFMRRYAPEKYHDLLIPDFEIGCKRRIFDPGYLASLHSPNMTLTSDQAVEILPSGVRTASGALIEADVIILANGFVTNGGEAYFPGITVVGRGGETAPEHWARLYGESGRAGAYNSTALAGFPNFFALLGPNAATGHTSTVMAIENSINYALRVIAPLLRSDDGEGQASAAEVKLEAERAYTERVQADLGKTVFASGCRSWYVERSADGREWNAATYPWSQAYFWWRSLFPVWRDWVYTVSIFNPLHFTLGWLE
jgi:cation diffusion facilitator CzcD-associated flavoprotein CzcO